LPVSIPTNTLAVIDHAGHVVIQVQLPNQDSGYICLLAVLTSHSVTRVGKEGSGNFGWLVAIYLLERDLLGQHERSSCVPQIMRAKHGAGRRR